MNRMKSTLVLAGFVAMTAGSLQAQTAPSKTEFRVEHNVLRWSSTTVKPESGSKQKSTGLQTTPDDLSVGIFWSDYGVYVAPNNAGGQVGLSYFFTKQVEAGLRLGLDHTEEEGAGSLKSESKSTDFGIFGTYYHPIDTRSSFEFTLALGMGNTETESTDAAGVTTKTEDSKSTSFAVLAQYVFQVAEHFSIMPGIGFSVGSTDDDAGTGSETDTDGLTLNLASFRYIF